MQADSPQTEVWTAVATTAGTSLLYERLRQRVMPPARLPQDARFGL